MDVAQSELFEKAWIELANGAVKRKHGFHLGVFANPSQRGIEARTVVLRSVDAVARQVRFHADLRSAKFKELASGDRIAWVFHCPNLKLQIRAQGVCQVLTNGLLVEEAWSSTQLLSRRCYLAQPGPGTPIDAKSSGLPHGLDAREPTLEESETGRGNFCVVATEVNEFDVYSLAYSGHSRCRFQFGDGTWRAEWLVP